MQGESPAWKQPVLLVMHLTHAPACLTGKTMPQPQGKSLRLSVYCTLEPKAHLCAGGGLQPEWVGGPSVAGHPGICPVSRLVCQQALAGTGLATGWFWLISTPLASRQQHLLALLLGAAEQTLRLQALRPLLLGQERPSLLLLLLVLVLAWMLC